MPDDGGAFDLHDTGLGAERILAKLDVVLTELRELRLALPARNERLSLPRVQVRTVAPLVHEISAAVGDLAWTARDLFDEASTDARLRGAIVAAIGPLDAGATRRLGRLLARCEGALLPSGHRVERVDDERPTDCATWRIVR
jgi:hypothetical protein